jgi:uncharacterized membrane protein YbhN (UPF0104 family)
MEVPGVRDPNDQTIESTPGDDPVTAAGDDTAAGLSETKPPSRRDAIMRIGIVIGVLFVVFVIILPRFIDYQEVIAALQGVSLGQFAVVFAFGILAWAVTGGIFATLIPGLGWPRGLEAYLILTGIGASIPLGPWNMAVLWVVIRGWGMSIASTTGGILLYGIFDQLSRFGLMFFAGIFLFVGEGLNRGVSVETGLIVGFLIVGGLLFVGLGGGLILIVRSEALARRLGRFAERVLGAILRRIGRNVPDIEGALVHFRVTLGDTVRQHGLAAILVSMVSKFAWALLMVVSMRVLGVSDRTLPTSVIVAGVALVYVITVLPISPGGAGVPELLYISFYTTYTGGADASLISAAVILFRAFQWGLPIPFAWGLLARSRRGKSLLPTAAEFRAADAAQGAPATG